jgi:hypothetical protein
MNLVLNVLQSNNFNPIAVARDKVYQLLAHGRRLSPGTSASSTPKAGRHDIAHNELCFFLLIDQNHLKYIIRFRI